MGKESLLEKSNVRSGKVDNYRGIRFNWKPGLRYLLFEDVDDGYKSVCADGISMIYDPSLLGEQQGEFLEQQIENHQNYSNGIGQMLTNVRNTTDKAVSEANKSIRNARDRSGMINPLPWTWVNKRSLSKVETLVQYSEVVSDFFEYGHELICGQLEVNLSENRDLLEQLCDVQLAIADNHYNLKVTLKGRYAQMNMIHDGIVFKAKNLF